MNLPASGAFTVRGSPEFDRWLAERLVALAQDVELELGGDMVAVVLGGGYGRGEGAVTGPRGAERPYNDLDLIAVVDDPSRATGALQRVSSKHERILGIAVDFGYPLTVRDVERWPHRLRWFDLFHGHVVLAGDPQILRRHAPAAVAHPVPAGEAAPLLLNRGAGLLWAERVRRGTERAPDPDFVRRNVYKALLAVGDAYLISWGAIEPGHRARRERLRALAHRLPPGDAGAIVAHYADAVTFKLAPDELAPEPVDPALFDAAVALWRGAVLDTESRRHGLDWPSLAAYARWEGPREPAGLLRRLRFLAANLRDGLLSAASPREPLYRALPELLGAPSTGPKWDLDSADFLRSWRRVDD